MKISKVLLLLMLVVSSLQAFSGELVLIKTDSYATTKQLFLDENLKIHYFNDEYIIATTDDVDNYDCVILDFNAWASEKNYYIAWPEVSMKSSWAASMYGVAEVLYEEGTAMFLSVPTDKEGMIIPPGQDAMVRIQPVAARLPQRTLNFSQGTLIDPDPEIEQIVAMVEVDSIMAHIQHLENYMNRKYNAPGGYAAQEWLAEYFESLGLEVEVMDFPYGNGSHDNVIGVLQGTLYPDEYVVIGGHYDSTSWSGDCPGADDNASGTSGVMEIARIMSQYEWDRTLIFCAWATEEVGLVGSNAYATRAAEQGMDILGYLNLDMIGYTPDGGEVHTDLLYPSSAQELADYFKAVTAAYVPDLPVYDGNLTGGDSDHTSFNNNGFMGIFAFEDDQNYSPHIHTSNDLIGPSVNSPELVERLTKANLATAAELSNRVLPPRNLVALPGDNSVSLSWTGPAEFHHYNLYRDDILLAEVSTNEYFDSDVENEVSYTYYVTVVFEEGGEESDPSNEVTVIPMPPLNIPYTWDFEAGAPYWDLDAPWGLTENNVYAGSFSLTDSPSGDYGNNLDISATIPSVSLEGCEALTLSFYTRYNLESGYDYAYVEVSTNGMQWTQLETFNGTANQYQFVSYDLTEYCGSEFFALRFRLSSDSYVTEDGIYFDDVMFNGVFTGNAEIVDFPGVIYPNPATDYFFVYGKEPVEVTVFDSSGEVKMEQRNSGERLDISHLESGIYFIRINSGAHSRFEKLIISK